MAARTRDEHLFAAGPKRVLSLDGGGLRGLLSLAYLERVEAILAARTSEPSAFRLADYFDLVGGGSTGAVIAAGLALGLRVEEIIDRYRNLAATVFRASPWRRGFLRPKFHRRRLDQVLQEIFGDRTLGSTDLRTGLAVVTKRLDTGSQWVLLNNPRSRFFNPGGGAGVPNRDIPIRVALRASTAAPTFFAPERVRVAPGETGLFIDGAVSPFVNPALLLLLVGTLRAYGLAWPLGRERLSLTSVGTGFFPVRSRVGERRWLPPPFLATRALGSTIADGNELTQTLLQWFSHTDTRREVDARVADLSDETPPGGTPLLTYTRYDALIERRRLLALGVPERLVEQVARLKAIDDPRNVEDLLMIGRVVAEQQVDAAHFPECFDLRTVVLSGSATAGATFAPDAFLDR